MRHQPTDSSTDPLSTTFSADEAAIYSRDMLLSLKGIATRQGQKRLADLLDAAAREAARLAGSQKTATISSQ